MMGLAELLAVVQRKGRQRQVLEPSLSATGGATSGGDAGWRDAGWGGEQDRGV